MISNWNYDIAGGKFFYKVPPWKLLLEVASLSRNVNSLLPVIIKYQLKAITTNGGKKDEEFLLMAS